VRGGQHQVGVGGSVEQLDLVLQQVVLLSHKRCHIGGGPRITHVDPVKPPRRPPHVRLRHVDHADRLAAQPLKLVEAAPLEAPHPQHPFEAAGEQHVVAGVEGEGGDGGARAVADAPEGVAALVELFGVVDADCTVKPVWIDGWVVWVGWLTLGRLGSIRHKKKHPQLD